jgi:hypothetical protein
MASRCPLAGYSIDPLSARFQAAFTVVFTSIGLGLPDQYRSILGFLLFLDYLTRALSKPQLSPIARICNALVEAIGVRKRKVDAGPKRFAARVGALFCLAIAVLSYQGETVPALVVTGILMIFALLEAAVGFCLGCAVYTGWYSIFGKDSDPDQFG